MVMGCQGDIHLFSGPGPQLRERRQGWRWLGGVMGGRGASQETPTRCSSPQAWPEAAGTTLGALSARYTEGEGQGGPEVKGQVESLF